MAGVLQGQPADLPTEKSGGPSRKLLDYRSCNGRIGDLVIPVQSLRSKMST
jgi:hypothetical protein